LSKMLNGHKKKGIGESTDNRCVTVLLHHKADLCPLGRKAKAPTTAPTQPRALHSSDTHLILSSSKML